MTTRNVSKKQILITGGMGFIGRHLVPALIKYGYFPIIIDKLSKNKSDKIIRSWRLKENVDFILIRKDIRYIKSTDNSLSLMSPEATIHLAAVHIIPYCESHKQLTASINIHGTKNIFTVSKHLGIERFIFMSSAAVYKPSKQPHKETAKVIPIDAYGLSKLKAENSISNHKINSVKNITIIRLFNVYGRDDDNPHFIPSILNQVRDSNTIVHGDLSTVRDYIHVDDVVSGVISILKKKSPDHLLYNLGTGNGYSGHEVIKIISRITKKDLILKKTTGLIRKVDRPILISDNFRFSREFNWSPKYSFQKGLNKIIKYKKI